jgi:hypothetical protein
MSSQLVALQKSYNLFEAQIIKSALISHGIYCEIFDETANTTLAMYKAALGGSRIMVRAADQEKALQIIKDANDLNEKTSDSNEE